MWHDVYRARWWTGAFNSLLSDCVFDTATETFYNVQVPDEHSMQYVPCPAECPSVVCGRRIKLQPVRMTADRKETRTQAVA